MVPIRCGHLNLDSFILKYLGLPLSVWHLRRVDFQHLKDKMDNKIPTWSERFIYMAGRSALVKSALASQAIYHLTRLIVPLGVTNNMRKIERAFLWLDSDKVTGAQC